MKTSMYFSVSKPFSMAYMIWFGADLYKYSFIWISFIHANKPKPDSTNI